MNPFFSIIIPVYNVAPYLRECLNSVLAQTFTDWEAICVDDGSTDDSGVILDEYGLRDNRFKVIHKKNEGVAIARNFALGEASGEYVGFVDGDDLIAKDLLDNILKIIKASPNLDWISLSGWISIGNGVTDSELSDEIVGDVEIISDAGLLSRGFRKLVNLSLVCLNYYRRSVISEIQFKPGIRYGEDDVFLLEAVQFVKVAAFVSYKGYFYRVSRPDAASRCVTMKDIAMLVENLHRIARKYVAMETDPNRCIDLKVSVAKFIDKFVYRVIWMHSDTRASDTHDLIKYTRALNCEGLICYRDIGILRIICLRLLAVHGSLAGYKVLVCLYALKHMLGTFLRGL